MCEELGINFHINRRNIQDHIKNKGDEIIKMIKNATKNKLLSIKFDCTTRNQRSILGINVQYVQNDKLLIWTIGMYELNSSYIGEYLREK